MAFYDRTQLVRKPTARFADGYMLVMLAALVCIVVVTVFARPATQEPIGNNSLAGVLTHNSSH
jgi:hypothetical protein